MSSKPKYILNEENVSELIALYRYHEVLRNVKLVEQHKNKDAGNQACKMTAEEKWMNLISEHLVRST